MTTYSFERINYELRPAKSVERKLICEMFRRLGAAWPLSSYRYVGFGSVFFSDFLQFHRALGIDPMFSIERAVEYQERFEFNKPFRCIKMKFGESSDVLPNLEWDSPAFVWLDYDGRLTPDVLGDVSICCDRIVSGSVLLVSINVSPPPTAAEDPEAAIDQYRREVGEDHLPLDVKGTELRGWGTARVGHRILTARLKSALRARNAGTEAAGVLHWEQVARFHYADGAKMLTVGWVFWTDGDREKLERAAVKQLPFARTSASDSAYQIDVPPLTFREMRHLDAQLPHSSIDEIDLPGVVRLVKQRYQRVYRYFPRFVEADVQ